MIRRLIGITCTCLLLLSAGCSGGGETTIQPTTTNQGGTGERPAMQTNDSGAQVDRGLRMDLGSERRSPPQ